jgi:hypothetical protein
MAQGYNDQPDESDGGGKPAGPNHEIVAAINALGKKYEAAQKGRPEHDRQTLKWAKRAGIGVGIYTLLTLGIAVVALCQLQTSRDSEQRQLRAYVGVVHPNGPLIDHATPPGIPLVVFDIKNFGQTPAYKMTYRSAIAVGPYPFPDHFGSEGKDEKLTRVWTHNLIQ